MQEEVEELATTLRRKDTEDGNGDQDEYKDGDADEDC